MSPLGKGSRRLRRRYALQPKSDEEQLLKVDVSGRGWTFRQRREALLDEFERSGTSAARFAALTGVKYPTFASWVQMRRRQRGGAVQALRALARGSSPEARGSHNGEASC